LPTPALGVRPGQQRLPGRVQQVEQVQVHRGPADQRLRWLAGVHAGLEQAEVGPAAADGDDLPVQDHRDRDLAGQLGQFRVAGRHVVPVAGQQP
jgi:hypothetical protein